MKRVAFALILILTAFYIVNYLKDNNLNRQYSRDEFGPTWYDIDNNGCDTRNDVLRLYVRNAVVTGDCQVIAGDAINFYTGVRKPFSPGPSFPIDHVVSLKDAWDSGAKHWTARQRLEFANDIGNLRVTDQATNSKKSDKGPDEWLPDLNECSYIKQYVTVKNKYGLTFTASQDTAIQKTKCLK